MVICFNLFLFCSIDNLRYNTRKYYLGFKLRDNSNSKKCLSLWKGVLFRNIRAHTIFKSHRMRLVNIMRSLFFVALLLSISSCKKSKIPRDASPDHYFYVGTYTNTGSKGIYLCKIDTATGYLKNIGIAAKLTSPAYLNISYSDDYLWASQEGLGETDSVVAYKIDTKTFGLSEINRQAVKGQGACYITSTNDNNYLGVACYGSGSITLLPLKANGSIENKPIVVKHHGKGLNPKRQESPHCHMIRQDNNGYFYVTDLGTDKIVIYKLSGDRLVQVDQILFEPGSGPRHIAFDPKGKYMAVVNELKSNVELYVKGVRPYFCKKQEFVRTIPASYEGYNTAADIHFSPDGRFLYASNRGHESVVCFAVQRADDNLKLIEYMRDQVKQPRSFAFDPSGRFLLVANQENNTIVAYKIEQDTGIPIFNGSIISIQSPVCVKFLNQYGLQ